jgi:predicted RNA binding protein YcfA (HicA-like mRNA interferase family)
MSRKLPAVNGADVIRAMGRAGFIAVRVRGSHHVLQHPYGRKIVVPVHAGETIGPGLLRKILRDTGITKEEFRTLLS